MIASAVDTAEGYISGQSPHVDDSAFRIRNEAAALIQKLTPLVLEWDRSQERISALARLRDATASPAPVACDTLAKSVVLDILGQHLSGHDMDDVVDQLEKEDAKFKAAAKAVGA